MNIIIIIIIPICFIHKLTYTEVSYDEIIIQYLLSILIEYELWVSDDISDFVYLILEAEKQAKEDPSEDNNVLRGLKDTHFVGILMDLFSGE